MILVVVVVVVVVVVMMVGRMSVPCHQVMPGWW